jgi:GT2 family glycosyltransferase
MTDDEAPLSGPTPQSTNGAMRTAAVEDAVDASNRDVDVTISIVNTNNRDLLKGCLDTLATSVGRLNCEIIVVDNASTDGSAELVRSHYPHVRLIETRLRDGYGRCHNRAIREARGRYILILNEDMEMLGCAIQRMVEIACTLPDLGVLGCRILNPDGSLQHSCFKEPTLSSELFEALLPYTVAFGRCRIRSKMYCWSHDVQQEVDVVVGCCMLVPRRVIEAIGPFDPDFFIYSEEHDLCRRARDCGFKVVFTPDAEMIHFGGQTTKRTSLRMALVQLDSRIRYFRKHHGPNSAFLFRAVLALGAALRLGAWSALYLCGRKQEGRAADKLLEHSASLRFVLGFARPI